MAGSSDYKNPLRGIKGLTPERVDMGVDYGGTGPVYAVGSGTILNVLNSGWPSGTFITEKLDSGPDAGKIVYESETINPRVHTGQHVTADTITSYMHGPASIELGWAEPPGTGLSLGHTQFSGSNATAYGKNFSDFLKSLGAPPGIVTGPIRGTVPPGFNTASPGSSTPSGNGGGILPNLNPVPYLLSNLGVSNFTDLMERGALIIFGAVLLIIGMIKMFPTQAGDAAEAVGLATGQEEIAAAGAAYKGRSANRARSKVRNKYNEEHAPDKDQEQRIMAEARERNKTTVVAGDNANATDRRMAGEKPPEKKGNPGNAVPSNLDVTSNDEPPF